MPASLDNDGYVVIADVLDAVALSTIRARVAYHLEHARDRDPTWRPGGTVHLDHLVDLDDAFGILLP